MRAARGSSTDDRTERDDYGSGPDDHADISRSGGASPRISIRLVLIGTRRATASQDKSSQPDHRGVWSARRFDQFLTGAEPNGRDVVKRPVV